MGMMMAGSGGDDMIIFTQATQLVTTNKRVFSIKAFTTLLQ